MAIATVKKTSMLRHDNYDDHFKDIKAWFEENMPNFFDDIEVYTHDPTRSYTFDKHEQSEGSSVATELVFYKNGKEIYALFPMENRLVLYCQLFTSHEYTDNKYLDGDSAYSNIYYNYVVQIVKISENIVGFTIGNREDVPDYSHISPCTIIFAKTNKGVIACIWPSAVFKNVSPVQINSSGTTVTNYICCTTINTKTDTPYYDFMTYYQASGSPSVFEPIDVVGDDDYVPNVFYVPISSALLVDYNDGYINGGERRIYYNGRIAFYMEEGEST